MRAVATLAQAWPLTNGARLLNWEQVDPRGRSADACRDMQGLCWRYRTGAVQ